MRPSIWPAPTRCRCWTCSAPGSPDPCGLQHPAGHVGEPGEHLADAGPLPGLAPWPSSWCSPAAVDLAGPDPLPLLDVLGAGQPRPLRPAGHVGEPGEHLASAGPLPLLDVLGAGQPAPCGLQHPAGHVSEPSEHLAGPDPLPLLDAPSAGRLRPLRPVGHTREPGEHLASAGPLPRLDVLGTGRPRPPRPAAPGQCWPDAATGCTGQRYSTGD